MTTVNCIPLEELTDRQLKAEYYEIQRVFKWVNASLKNGKPMKIPETYSFGPGHAKFFYDKLQYCADRLIEIIDELKFRKMRVQPLERLPTGIPKRFFGRWQPTSADQELNREWLARRAALQPEKPKRPVLTPRNWD